MISKNSTASKQDGLDGSNSRRSIHEQNGFCSVTVRKSHPKEKAGIRLEHESTGRVRVCSVARNGLFADSQVQVGDIVLSINGKRIQAGQGAEALVDIIRTATSTITMVVKKKMLDQTDAASVVASSERNDRSDEEPMTISVTKSSKNEEEDVGLVLIVHHKMIVVQEIVNDSIFQGTSLAVGDRVLSINDMSFREYADANYARRILQRAKTTVTLVVEKGIPFVADKPPTRKQRVPKKDTSICCSGSSKPKKKETSHEGPEESSLTTSTESWSTSYDSEQEEDGDKLLPLKSCTLKETVIAVAKEFSAQDAGLEFQANKRQHLIVSKIKPSSIFLSSSLKEGDRILAINDVDFRNATHWKAARLACLQAKEAISLLVQTKENHFQQAAFNLDSSMGNLDWS